MRTCFCLICLHVFALMSLMVGKNVFGFKVSLEDTKGKDKKGDRGKTLRGLHSPGLRSPSFVPGAPRTDAQYANTMTFQDPACCIVGGAAIRMLRKVLVGRVVFFFSHEKARTHVKRGAQGFR